MAIQLQLRSGTTSQNDIFTGAAGELTYNTDTSGLRIHDGQTMGGFEVPVLVAVQRPTAENNYTWYRKYSDGWVEMGGSADLNQTSGTLYTVILPVEMADTRYTILATEYSNNSGTGGYSVGWRSKTTTSFVLAGCSAGTNITNTWDWQVSGMAASD